MARQLAKFTDFELKCEDSDTSQKRLSSQEEGERAFRAKLVFIRWRIHQGLLKRTDIVLVT